MNLTNDELLVLRSMASVDRNGESTKCANTIRIALDSTGELNESTIFAYCNTGYENERVGDLYDAIRSLVLIKTQKSVLVEGRGDFLLPSGPRYTDCEITNAGHRLLESLDLSGAVAIINERRPGVSLFL